MRHGRELDVLLYGATGYTGRLLARALSERDVRWGVGGRPSPALDALGATLNVPVVAAALDDSTRLADAFGRAQVVLTAAGPFLSRGRAQQEAALAAQTHLLDLSGEPEYLLQSLALDEPARARGVALVGAVGFDVVPSELLAGLAAHPLPSPLKLLEVAIAHAQGMPSRGTLLSHREMAERGATGLAYAEGRWSPEPFAHHRRIVELPAPFGPRAAVSVPSSEVAVLPRAIRTREARFYLATLAPAALAVAEKGLAQFSDEGVDRTLRMLEGRASAGPSDTERASSRFAIWARAVGEAQERVLVMTGADPYGVTARVAVEAASQAAAPTFSRTGVLTPTQAFDRQRLLATLAQVGVRWTTAR
jgi:short subunit dehydrogenase-like uncharacterized protein